MRHHCTSALALSPSSPSVLGLGKQEQAKMAYMPRNYRLWVLRLTDKQSGSAMGIGMELRAQHFSVDSGYCGTLNLYCAPLGYHGGSAVHNILIWALEE